MKVGFLEPVDIQAGLDAYLGLLAQQQDDGIIADFLVFCWQAVDPGRVAALDLADDVLDACADKMSELLEFIEHRCDAWSVPGFWRRYIQWADFGEELQVEECMEFMRRVPGYIEPAFFVFLATPGQEMRREAMCLLAAYSGERTTRESYVKSVLESRLRSEAARGRRLL